MPIKPLVELRVEHPYYASGVAGDVQMVPDAATAQRLRGLRLLARPSPGGLTLYGELGDDGTPVIAIPEQTLRFDLLRLSPEVEAASDLSALLPGTVFVAAGTGKPMKAVVREVRAAETVAKPEGTATVVLAGRPLAGSGADAFHVASPRGVGVAGYDAAGNRLSLTGPAGEVALDYPVAPPSTPGVLAGIEVAIGPDDDAAAEPRRFTVRLKAAAARWCYHLVTDLPDPLADWRIAHPAGDGPAANFGDGGRAELAAGDAGDPFGSDLHRRSAPLRVLRFVSDAAIPCSEIRARRISLFAGDRQLIAALPNPSPGAMRQVSGQPAFGEVLRFVTT